MRLAGESGRSIRIGSAAQEERRIFWIALILKLLFVAVIGLFALFSYTHAHLVEVCLEKFLNWIQRQGRWSPVLFTLVYTCVTVAFFPAELLNISGGFVFSAIYGKAGGVCLAILCCELGIYGSSIICFSLARYFLYGTVYCWCRRYRVYQAFSRAVEDGGTCFVALLRLSPVIPLTLTTYLFGVTTLRLRQLLLGTASSIFLTAIFVWLGSELNAMRQIATHGLRLTWGNALLIIFGVGMAVAALVYISRLTRRRLMSAYNSDSEEAFLLDGYDTQPAASGRMSSLSRGASWSTLASCRTVTPQ